MPKDSKTYIVNDQATETDALDFTPYVETLADIVQTGNTPLTIGVFGTWGSGKTSLRRSESMFFAGYIYSIQSTLFA
jgi:pantothenate kinase-related protein Tda10